MSYSNPEQARLGSGRQRNREVYKFKIRKEGNEEWRGEKGGGGSSDISNERTNFKLIFINQSKKM